MARNAVEARRWRMRQARYEARHLRMWWTPDKGMLHLHGAVARCDGRQVRSDDPEADRADEARQGSGVGQRASTAPPMRWWLMCDAVDVAEQIETPMLAAQPVLHGTRSRARPAAIAGIPFADAMVEQLRANATHRTGAGRRRRRPGRGREAHRPRCHPRSSGRCCCATGTAAAGTVSCRYGLQVHHLTPRSWGGTDDLANLAAVCSTHHPLLIPHGPRVLIGNPNQPDGLRTVHLDDLTPEQRQQLGLPPPRAGPNAGMSGARRVSAVLRRGSRWRG